MKKLSGIFVILFLIYSCNKISKSNNTTQKVIIDNVSSKNTFEMITSFKEINFCSIPIASALKRLYLRHLRLSNTSANNSNKNSESNHDLPNASVSDNNSNETVLEADTNTDKTSEVSPPTSTSSTIMNENDI